MSARKPDRHDPAGARRRIAVEEEAAIPLDGLLLGYGAMLPFPFAVAAILFGDPAASALAGSALQLWASAILLFLSGVRRGLSFRTPGGPRIAQIAMSLWLFAAGLAALGLPPAAAAGVQLAGYASLLVLDPIAARREEAPLYFARLRPVQMTIPVGSLALLLLAT
jgi:hypothetical protein